jgi:NAD-dependent deacetylase
LGSQLRPHIVWFGEPVPAISDAIPYIRQADIMVVVGTSLVVYPAAGLLNYLRADIPVFVVDPNVPTVNNKNVKYIQKKAGEGINELISELEKLK